MSWRSLLAAQSRQPSGLIGRLFMGPYLDRANRRINDLVYAALALPSHAQVLEIGFGGGDLLIRVAAGLEQGRIDGIEPSTEMLAVARRRADKTAWAGRIELHRAGVDGYSVVRE